MHYFTSVGYLGQDGNIDNFNYRRYNVRTNIESDFAKNFHFTLGVAGNVGRRHTPGYASGGTDSDSYLGGTRLVVCCASDNSDASLFACSI